MTVPEASMNEHRSLPRREHEIWCPGQIYSVQSEA